MGEHHKHYTGIRNGLWTWEHIQRMGMALGLFGWCVSRQTAQNGSTGLVLGGQAIRIEQICRDLEGAPRRNVERWLARLRDQGYIETTWTPQGVIIRVLHAKKEKWSQHTLFEPTPQMAGPATSGAAINGVAQDKSGGATPAVLSIKSQREKAKKKTPASADTPEFTAFWEHYPRKEAKEAARRAWKKIQPEELPAILAGIEAYRQTDQWQDVRFIPHPATFLSQRRWEDTPPAGGRHGRSKAEERSARNLAAAGFERAPDS